MYSKEVEEIQVALNAQYPEHANYPLATDGLVGPKTCGALYKLQKEWMDNDSSTITMDTIQVLDTAFGDAHLAAVVNKCKPYFKGGGGEATGPVIDPGSATIDPGAGGTISAGKKSNLPILLAGAALGGGLGYMGHKQGFIKRGTSSVAAGVGAAAGALTFWMVNKKKKSA